MEQVINIFRRKDIQGLKKRIMNNIGTLKMSEDRKCYFLHQLANVHDMASMEDLITYINALQLMESVPQDLVHIS